jgi:hypothetical protein
MYIGSIGVEKVATFCFWHLSQIWVSRFVDDGLSTAEESVCAWLPQEIVKKITNSFHWKYGF